jgi:HSP20 family protein
MPAEREQAAATRSDAELTRRIREFVPRADIYETDKNLVLVADMPGVKPEGLDIGLEKNILTIHGRTEAPDVGERELVNAEYELGDYHRAFTLSDEIDQDKIEASLKDGVLTLRLPKSEKARVKKVPVKLGQ